jgi:two-component system, chemotaxis family, chemotaxis protein CheY
MPWVAPLSANRDVGTERSARVSMRVLIADDQKGVGTTLAALVAECNHEVVEVVASGFEAIQAYHRLRPDVVLMDYFMPRLNGATACRNILSRYPGANVILVSGVVEAEDIINSGATAVLAKPVNLAQLRMLLSGSLSFHAKAPASQNP